MQELSNDLKLLTTSDEEMLPQSIIKWVEKNKDYSGLFEYQEEELTYVLVSLGVRPSPGYQIEVDKIERGEANISLYIKELLPDGDKFYPQVVSCPYVLASAKESIKVHWLGSSSYEEVKRKKEEDKL